MQSFKEFADYIMKHSRHNEVKSDRIHIILNYPKIQWDEYAEYMATLTWYTSIGWSRGGSKNCSLIFAETLDEALAEIGDDYDYALVSYIGTFYNNYQTNAPDTIHTFFDHFCSTNDPCRGHILMHPDRPYLRLHLQCMFLNVKHWRSIDKPSFGKYTGKVMYPNRSVSNVHDDYTPHWIEPSEDYRLVKDAEQGEYLTRVLEDGKKILNFAQERNTKFFCYPERRSCIALDFERNRQSNIIYARNNESMIRKYDERVPHDTEKFDVIYAPAGGCSAEFLYDKLGHENTKLIIYDYNAESVKWKKLLYEMVDTPEDMRRVNKMFEKKEDVIVDYCQYKPELIQEIERIFPTEKWIEIMHRADVDIIQHDLLDKTLDVDPNKRNLIYLSNIFSYNFLIHKMRVEDIHNKFKEYLNLPNTTVYGNNVFRDLVVHENHSS